MPSRSKSNKTMVELENLGGGHPPPDLGDYGPESIVASKRKRKTKKKRAVSNVDLAIAGDADDADCDETPNVVLVEDDFNEPTMGEKLAILNLQEDNVIKSDEQEETSPRLKPPSADSVNILLRQALRADDQALLLDCLYTQDEKVIANSISLLNASDALKLLQSFINIIQSRGAILACALPWLKSLLLQHATGVMSQESSMLALNSLYKLMESRVSTFQPALQLSSCMDTLYSGIADEISEENETIVPVIYQDEDESDEQESEDIMETDGDTKGEPFDGSSDAEGSAGMSE